MSKKLLDLLFPSKPWITSCSTMNKSLIKKKDNNSVKEKKSNKKNAVLPVSILPPKEFYIH